MTESKYSAETVYQVWNDRTGERIEIGADRDGLNLVEVRQYDDVGTIIQGISFTEDQATLIHIALGYFLDFAKTQFKNQNNAQSL